MRDTIKTRLAQAIETTRATVDRLLRLDPRRRVTAHAVPILRWYAGDVPTFFRDRLECGHLLATNEGRPRFRRCFKCARGLPADSRVRVRPGQRKAVTA